MDNLTKMKAAVYEYFIKNADFSQSDFTKLTFKNTVCYMPYLFTLCIAATRDIENSLPGGNAEEKYVYKNYRKNSYTQLKPKTEANSESYPKLPCAAHTCGNECCTHTLSK